MFGRMLVPLDGSPMAEAVLPVAERIAALLGGTLVLLHVIEIGASPTIHGQRHLTTEAEAQRYLDALAVGMRSRGVACETHVHAVPEGDVADSVAGHGAEEHTDLIVLCTHGSGGVRELVFGSIAQQVLQRGTVPVLLVRAPAADVPAAPFAPRIILVPLDGTSAGELALAPAGTLAHALGATLHLTLVVATQGTIRGNRSAVATLLPSATRALLEAEVAQGEAYLDAEATALRAQGLQVETEVRRGRASDELATETVEHSIGLVVAATHGRAGLSAIWAGSVAAGLLARTAAPVLLLRRWDKD